MSKRPTLPQLVSVTIRDRKSVDVPIRGEVKITWITLRSGRAEAEFLNECLAVHQDVEGWRPESVWVDLRYRLFFGSVAAAGWEDS